MLLGLTRPRLRSDGSRLFALRNLPIALHPADDWASERGNILFEASADIIGGFPGYADRGCVLEDVHLRITDRYLLADEGHPHGFGLPLNWIEGSTLIAQPNRDDYALRIFYRIAGTPRLFTVRFRLNRIGARGPRRSLRAQEALHTAGIVDRFAADPPSQPAFTLPWDQTREFENESVIWTGRATAPVHVSGELAPSEVWLTTKSLIWGSGDGEGINRIPLPLLMDLVSTRLRDRLGTPVIYVAIGDESTGRYELPFAFNLQTPPDRNFRERGALLVGLRSRGVADGATAPYNQPWRPNLLTPDPEPAEFDIPDEAEFALDADAAIEQLDTPELPEFSQAEPQEMAEPAVPPIAPLQLEPSQCGNEPTRRRGGLAGRIRRATAQRPPDPRPEPEPESELEAEAEMVHDDPPALDETDELPVVTGSEAAVDEPDAETFDAAVEPAVTREDPTERFAIQRPTVTDPEEDDIVLAEWSYTTEEEPPPTDLPIAESWSPTAEHDQTAMSGEDETVERESPANPFVAVTTEPWAAVRHYEEVAVGALAEALRVIDDCVGGHCGEPLAEHAPSSWDQARALAELDGLALRGLVSDEDARHRKDRLLALGETCVRLRTLVELHDHGYLSIEELDRKRGALVKSLSAALVREQSPRQERLDVA